MVHITKQEDILEKPTGSIDKDAMAETAKPLENASKYYGWKGANRKKGKGKMIPSNRKDISSLED